MVCGAILSLYVQQRLARVSVYMFIVEQFRMERSHCLEVGTLLNSKKKCTSLVGFGHECCQHFRAHAPSQAVYTHTHTHTRTCARKFG